MADRIADAGVGGDAGADADAGDRPKDEPKDEPAALPVAAWIRPGRTGSECLRVHLEGDGLAWRSRRRPSRDPTPVDPVGLRMAVADRSGDPLVYLGRPCQYGGADTAACHPLLWTAARYGEDVVRATNARLDGLIASLGGSPRRVVLIGYSGGGVVAALLAARRDDVARLITVAAPLDLDAWTRMQRVSPLALSHSPANHAEALSRIPQDHFVGEDDRRVPVGIVESFQHALEPGAPSRIHRVPGMDHRDWPARWPMLLEPLEPLCREPGASVPQGTIQRDPGQGSALQRRPARAQGAGSS